MIVPAAHSAHLPKLSALMAELSERPVLEPFPYTGWYLCSINFHFCGKLDYSRAGATEVCGHFSSSAFHAVGMLCGMPALAWRQGTCVGLIMFQTAVVRVSGVKACGAIS